MEDKQSIGIPLKGTNSLSIYISNVELVTFNRLRKAHWSQIAKNGHIQWKFYLSKVYRTAFGLFQHACFKFELELGMYSQGHAARESLKQKSPSEGIK